MSRRLRPALLAPLLLMLLSLTGQASPRSSTLPLVVDAPMVFDYPLPPSAPVSDQWFSDAVFIGDSRTEDLLSSHLFQPGLALAQTGLSVRSIRSEAVFASGNERLTLFQALWGGTYTKVYLALGFNEASWMEEEDFYREYGGLIDDLQSLLPHAQIYLQTLIPVTLSRAATQSPDNAMLANRSALIRRLAHDKQAYLLDVSAAFTGINGDLSPSLSSDGLHLTSQGNSQWYDYLCTHTMGT